MTRETARAALSALATVAMLLTAAFASPMPLQLALIFLAFVALYLRRAGMGPKFKPGVVTGTLAVFWLVLACGAIAVGLGLLAEAASVVATLALARLAFDQPLSRSETGWVARRS